MPGPIKQEPWGIWRVISWNSQTPKNRCVLACDAKCHLAWGHDSRTKHYFGDPEEEPDDFESLSDGELGEAPKDNGQPTTPEDRLNKWCVRECERGRTFEDGEEIQLPNYANRIANYHSREKPGDRISCGTAHVGEPSQAEITTGLAYQMRWDVEEDENGYLIITTRQPRRVYRDSDDQSDRPIWWHQLLTAFNWKEIPAEEGEYPGSSVRLTTGVHRNQ